MSNQPRRGEPEPLFPFQVGATYANRQRTYRVLEVTATRLRVRFDNGTTGGLDREVQSRILANMARDARKLKSA